ncbi:MULTISPECIES: ABC transporter ATP-binding protein [Achromobacter]|jgi:iron(III) transport system ATP-binding protein|uniref:ABC transporter ATP-binding protein n=2 Tax=Achromobacter TaxID=222 RepID=A0A848NMJ3_9BURK|nr:MULTISPECIES: ABC transporter ATP-binding protein [Achromobacter]MCH4581728.1 ABC transporter ATP-binding protein [Achromobacter xylosoxidans]MCI1837027.1 ABC transporter ATP-binding protein [Achromobacter ruhlandii]MCZ8408007.1 ABC transporter ATP-binding protein [Achromobacter dolens]MEB6662380.1 ABC transporter ATP-binding protein [Achromobacter ruhlandii]NMU92284.1 ABC transporter ATP-binding protein [Achromobacter ruhlandii]
MASITVDGIIKTFGGQQVLRDLSLHIPDGGFYTLLGPSGCGKTTLLRCIAGFYAPDGGRLLFDQDDVTHVSAHRRDIGMVFQDYALFPDKTAFDNVAYGLRARGVARAEIKRRVDEALDKVGLAALADRYPAQMSGGQRQRVALARALVIRPRVLLMDEPLSNLDAKMRLQMRDVILDLVREAGITTVFVTHDQEEALAMSDRIAIMDHGRIAQLGTPEELYGTPVNAYVADFIGSANVIPVPARGGLPGAPAGHVRYELCGLGFDGTLGSDTLAERAVLIARPEELALMAPAPYVPNTLPGKVLRRQYLGFKTAYRIALQDGSEIRVELHAGNMVAQFQPGEAVQVLIPADSRVVNA